MIANQTSVLLQATLVAVLCGLLFLMYDTVHDKKGVIK